MWVGELKKRVELLNKTNSGEQCSLELGHRVAVALEGSIKHAGSGVVEVGHGRLAHGTVPRHVTRLSVAVAVHNSVVLMEHGVLANRPVLVGVSDNGVLGEDLSEVEEEEVGVVEEGLHVEVVVVDCEGSGLAETSSETSHDEVNGVAVGQPASGVETLDGELQSEFGRLFLPP